MKKIFQDLKKGDKLYVVLSKGLYIKEYTVQDITVDVYGTMSIVIEEPIEFDETPPFDGNNKCLEFSYVKSYNSATCVYREDAVKILKEYIDDEIARANSVIHQKSEYIEGLIKKKETYGKI